jgi:hypothetical protein
MAIDNTIDQDLPLSARGRSPKPFGRREHESPPEKTEIARSDRNRQKRREEKKQARQRIKEKGTKEPIRGKKSRLSFPLQRHSASPLAYVIKAGRCEARPRNCARLVPSDLRVRAENA